MNVATHLNFNDLVAAHETKRAIRLKLDAADVPDGPEYDAAHEAKHEAMRALADAPCTHEQFTPKLAYIFACDAIDAGEPPCQGEDYGPVAVAVQAFLEQLAA